MELPLGKFDESKGPASFRRYYKSLDPILGKPKNRAYTTTILSFLVISLFLWYAIRPTVQTILSLRREIHDDLEVNAQMETKINNLVEAQAVYQDSAQKLALLPQALPRDPNVVAVLLAFQTMSQEAHATISGIEVQSSPIDSRQASASGKPTITQNGVSVPVTVAFKGTYDGLKQILDNILGMRRIVTISGFTFSNSSNSREASDPNPQLELIIKILVNYFPGATYER